MPDSMTISSLPKGVAVQSKLGNFTSSYAMQDKTLIITRKLDLQISKATCNSADYAELKTLANAVNQDMRSQSL